MHKLHQLLKEVPPQFFIVFACKVECLGDIGASQCFEESLTDLGACERWSCSEVVCDSKTIVMFWKVCEGQSI